MSRPESPLPNIMPFFSGGALTQCRGVSHFGPGAPGTVLHPNVAGSPIVGVLPTLTMDAEQGSSVPVITEGVVLIELESMARSGALLQVASGGTFEPLDGGVIVAQALEGGGAGDVIRAYLRTPGVGAGLFTWRRTWGGGVAIEWGDGTRIET